MASWSSRLPAIRDELGLTPGQLGLLIVALSGGAVVSLPLAGAVVRRLSPARSVAITGVMVAVGLVVVGSAPSAALVAVGLAAIGSGSGIWDVAMNVEGADVEQRLGRSIMPRFHGGFSLGTVVGAALGSLAAALDAPVSVHLPVMGVIVGLVAVAGSRYFLPVVVPEPVADSNPGTPAHPGTPAPGRVPGTPASGRVPGTPAPGRVPGTPASGRVPGTPAPGLVPGTPAPASSPGTPAPASSPGTPAPDDVAVFGRPVSALGAWRERRTLTLGVLVLGMGLAEGVANDWLALALVDGYGADHALAAGGFGVFLVAMTVTRLSGVVALERFGRVPVMRAGALSVALGAGLVMLGSYLDSLVLATACAVLGALIWGAGAALGFPVGMSAAADDPASASVRVSVVSTIGYLSFLGGPPLLGLVADRTGVATAIGCVFVATALALAAAGAARPLAGTTRLAPRAPA